MRLVDSDAIQYTHAIARSIEDGHNWNELCVTKDEIADMPTIDAIPVEWLRKIQADSDGPWDATVYAIDNIIRWWKRENGMSMNNSEKNGIWESLGHRIGFGKHPQSEDFRCSLCGYEAYTIFDPPPERCPECDANMSMEQGAK